MDFRVVVEIDRAARRSFVAQARGLAHGPERRFWTAFRAATERAGEVSKADSATAVPLADSVADIHQQLRRGLPDQIRRLLIERLAPRLDVPAEVAGSPDDETAAALAALRIEIGEIRGGSLELLVIAFGFAKLATLAGITSEEFAGYLKIVTPFALNLLYGTNVPLVATAQPAGGADAPRPAEEGPTAAGLRLAQQSWPYIIPAALVGFVLWLVVTTFDAESGRLTEERKAVLETVSKQETDLATERTALAQKLAELAGKLLDATAQREAALETANRDLSTRQMALITRLDATAPDRDKAVIDYVKARLSPPSPAPGCVPPTGETVRALQRLLRTQHLYTDAIDGDFGLHSRVGLASFQLNAGLPVTGLPDRATMDRLGLACEPAR